jgi:hypothetical protein
MSCTHAHLAAIQEPGEHLRQDPVEEIVVARCRCVGRVSESGSQVRVAAVRGDGGEELGLTAAWRRPRHAQCTLAPHARAHSRRTSLPPVNALGRVGRLLVEELPHYRTGDVTPLLEVRVPSPGDQV